MTPVRMAVVGLGGIAQSVHLPLIQRNRAEVELVALAELSPARLATLGRRYGVPEVGWFSSAEELAAAVSGGRVAVDAAILATAGSHVNDALSLIRADVRVLVEKPLAYSFSELDVLSAGLRELGRDPDEWLRVGYMKEYDPAVEAARTMMPGVSPREVMVEVLHPADERQIAFARCEAPATDVDPGHLQSLDESFQRSLTTATGTDDVTLRKLYSNVVLGSIVHDLALTRHLGLGLAEVLHAQRCGTDFPGSVIGLGLTEEGVPWSIRWHFIKNCPEYRERITIHHEEGSIELQFATPYILNAPTTLRVLTGGQDLRSTLVEQVWPQDEAFERELLTLVAMTRGVFTAGSSIDAARKDLTSAQALWRSCATAAGIAIDPTCEAAAQPTGNNAGGRDPHHP